MNDTAIICMTETRNTKVTLTLVESNMRCRVEPHLHDRNHYNPSYADEELMLYMSNTKVA